MEYEEPTIGFHRTRVVRCARRPHICECGDIIMPGDSYRLHVWLEDGKIVTTKEGLSCPSCLSYGQSVNEPTEEEQEPF